MEDNYTSWKSWDLDGRYKDNSRKFSQEIKRTKTMQGAHILEVGFGQGLFLEWAENNGYQVTGIEINPSLVETSKKRGHDVHHGELADLFTSKTGCFDLIVLFDVLEHIPLVEYFDLFIQFERLLTDTGKLLLRFPNGASPFGRYYQYGDATHQTVLTGRLVEQIAMATGLIKLSSHNAARWNNPPKIRGKMKDWLAIQGAAYLFRDMIQIPLSLIYFGKIVPMDPNMTVILGKRNSKTKDSIK